MAPFAADGNNVKRHINTIKLSMDEHMRVAVINFGTPVSETGGPLYAAFNRIKREHCAELAYVTPIEPGVYRIQTGSEREFVGAVRHFVLAGMELLDWERINTEVIQTEGESEQRWSLSGADPAGWTIIQPQ